MARVWVKDQAQIQNIRTRIAVVAMLVNEQAGREAHSGTAFNTHKSLNILYKELIAHKNLLDCMAGVITKKQLRDWKPEVQEPQSRKMFLA